MPEPHATESGFYGLGLAPRLLEAINHLHFTSPTPIQRQAIPIAVTGKDVIGIAQTGTGKTLAFGLPMLQRLAQVKGLGLVVLPTRELALQVDESLRQMGRDINLRTAVLIGGEDIKKQQRALARRPHVIIATPGRLIDHLEQRLVNLSEVKILVLDEADRMFDMGFAPQIKRILQAVPPPKLRQTMLFSATMPDEIVRIATQHMALPLRIEVARSGRTADKVSHELFVVNREDKKRLLEKLLGEYRGSVLVFCRTKFGAKGLTRGLKTMGVSCAEIHSNRSLSQRREALEGFKSGQYRVLIATDIAARGIDVTGIELVVNYDLPGSAEDYVHRIGRTGRAGLAGHAISFATRDQGGEVRDIEKLIQLPLPISKLPELPPHRPAPEYRRGPRIPARTGRRPHRHQAFGRTRHFK